MVAGAAAYPNLPARDLGPHSPKRDARGSGGAWYAARVGPAGGYPMPDLYPDFGHPEGIGAKPWFTIRDDELYPAFGHPDGIGAQPWFRIG